MTPFRTSAFTISVAMAMLGGAALAHPRLLQTSPAANTTVGAPVRIELKFSEPLVGPLTGADVLMVGTPGAQHQAPAKMPGFAARLGADHKTFMLTAPRPLAAGTYRVAWHAVSVDTHRVQGSFAFAVK